MIDYDKSQRADLKSPCPCDAWKPGCYKTCQDPAYLLAESNRRKLINERKAWSTERYYGRKDAVRRNRSK